MLKKQKYIKENAFHKWTHEYFSLNFHTIKIK